jgi:hypothetical protein
MPVNIFICYRRSDSISEAQNLKDKLSIDPGIGSVFVDVSSIKVGEDWPDFLLTELSRADIVIVIVGPNWLTISDKDSGRRLIDYENDSVRKEIRTALDANKKIIPVLIRTCPKTLKNFLTNKLSPFMRKIEIMI